MRAAGQGLPRVHPLLPATQNFTPISQDRGAAPGRFLTALTYFSPFRCASVFWKYNTAVRRGQTWGTVALSPAGTNHEITASPSAPRPPCIASTGREPSRPENKKRCHVRLLLSPVVPGGQDEKVGKAPGSPHLKAFSHLSPGVRWRPITPHTTGPRTSRRKRPEIASQMSILLTLVHN